MVASLEWIRDNYDANRNRYIEEGEVEAAKADWIDDKITTDEYQSVVSAYNDHKLLPSYEAEPPTCPVPVVYYTESPEIWFVGSTAYCKISIDVGTGNTIDSRLSQLEVWDGEGWVVGVLSQLDMSRSSQVKTISWEMKDATDEAVCQCFIRNSCGETPRWVNTDYYKYPPEEAPPPTTCPRPIVRYTESPEIWFVGTRANCRISIDVGAGNKVDRYLSTVELWDGEGWVPNAISQLDMRNPTQVRTLTWEMKDATDEAVCKCLIKSNCGASSGWVSTDYYEYPADGAPPPTCPKPTVRYTKTPAIWFRGTKAYCEISVDTKDGSALSARTSTIEAYDGEGWVPNVISQLNLTKSSQTATLSWEMKKTSNSVICKAFIKNACDASSGWVNTGYHSYTAPHEPPPPTDGGDPSSSPTSRSIAVGDHNITVTKSGYNTVYAKINVSSAGSVTCKEVTGGRCGGTGYPRVEASGTSVRVYMATGVADGITSYIKWVESKGGASGLRGKLVPVGEIIDGYLSSVGDPGYLGFVVSLGNVGSTIDYYLG